MCKRRALSLLVAGMLMALSGAAVSTALAQDSGIDQYLENPGAVPNGGGDDGGGGNGGSGGGSDIAPGGSSSGPASADGSSGAEGAASGTVSGTNGTAGTGADSRSARAGETKAIGQNKDQRHAGSDTSGDEVADSAFGQADTSDVDESGSGGIGIALPIILGALLLAAIVVAVVRHRRRRTYRSA